MVALGVVQVLIVKIKQAECALADGRLDEAFEITKAENVRSHRRGQKLIGKLSRALAKRGQDNLSANQLQQALSDCNKADKLGGSLPEITNLRQAICNAMEQNTFRNHQRSLKLAQAKENIENGWLSVGEKILKDDFAGQQADVLLQDVAAKRLKNDSAIKKAIQALNRDNLESAIDIINKAGIKVGQNETADEVITKITEFGNQQITDNLNNARIDLAAILLEKMNSLATESAENRQLNFIISQFRESAKLVEKGQFQAVSQTLQKIKTIFPSAKWLDTSIKQAKQANEAIEALNVGPLGLFITNDIELHDPVEKSSLPFLNNNTKGHCGSQIPSKFILQIDGIGSFLVFRSRTITVGPISSSARPDLGLLAEPNIPVAAIERTDEDYFINSQKPIYINENPATKKLLTNSDSIALSSRCRMKFQVPNAASTTAVLDLDGARLPRPDVQRIILMDRDILIGPGFNSHIRTQQVKDTVTLFIKNGKLNYRTKEKVTVNNQLLKYGSALPVDTAIQIGHISLVLAKLDE